MVKKTDIEIHATHKEEKYVAAKRVIREFIKIHKYMTLVSKSVCSEK